MKEEEFMYYREYKDNIDMAMKAMDEKNMKKAKYHLYKASSSLLKLAQIGEKKSKEKRYRMAERLIKLADSLKKNENSMNSKNIRKDMEERNVEFTTIPKISFDDIADLEEAKREVMLKAVLPLKYPEKARKYGKTPGGGILLYGPPGTGKTMLAKATANEVNAPFFSIAPSNVLSKWFGEAEKKISELFEKARSYELSVVFIDEIESLVPSRSDLDSSPMNRVVAQILTELDGMKEGEGRILFIGATNVPWKLDPAVLRPGRFDVLIYVGLPDEKARRQMFEMFLNGLPLSDDVDFDELVKVSNGYTGADIKSVCEEAKSIPFLDAVIKGIERPISMCDFKKAFEKVNPSVDLNMMRKYEEFSKKRMMII